MQSKQLVLLDSLRLFYAVPENANKLVKCIGCSHPENHVSLRVVDWLVTNFAKSRNLQYDIDLPDGTQRHFNVHLSYKACLKSWSKKHFDPFARRERVFWEVTLEGGEKKVFHTTCAQLCFFRWAISNKVWDWALENKSTIEQDMNNNIKKMDTSKRRKELSKNNTRTHFMFNESPPTA